MYRIVSSFVVCAAVSMPVAAQSSIKDSLVKHWNTSGDFTMQVAKAMPADGYSFKPTAGEMTFGHLMGHVAMSDLGACAAASGMERPQLPANVTKAMKDDNSVLDKDSVMQLLQSTFDFCNKAVASMTDDKLAAIAGTQRKMSGFDWLWAYFTHTAHHRGQAEVYLRLKGITPPSYEF